MECFIALIAHIVLIKPAEPKVHDSNTAMKLDLCNVAIFNLDLVT